MVLRPYRLIFGGKEIRGTSRYRLDWIASQMIKSGEGSLHRIKVIETLKDGEQIVHSGLYKAYGTLRPTIFHVRGDNPLGCPKKPKHKTRVFKDTPTYSQLATLHSDRLYNKTQGYAD